MLMNVNDELDEIRISRMRRKIIELERDNIATQKFKRSVMIKKISDIIREEAFTRY